MLLSLAVTLVVGLFLGQSPAATDALSTRQGPGDYQAMKDAAALGRRNFYDSSSKSSQGEYNAQGSYETGGQYDQSGSYSSSKGYSSPSAGDDYGVKKDSYDSGKDSYSCGKDSYSSGKDSYSTGSGYDVSKTKSYAAYKDDSTPSYKDSSSNKDSYKKTDSDYKKSDKYNEIKDDKKPKDAGYYEYTKSKNYDNKDGSVPSHLDHEPISVPKEPTYTKDDYKSGADGKAKTSGYSADNNYGKNDGGYGKKEKNNYA